MREIDTQLSAKVHNKQSSKGALSGTSAQEQLPGVQSLWSIMFLDSNVTVYSTWVMKNQTRQYKNISTVTPRVMICVNQVSNNNDK